MSLPVRLYYRGRHNGINKAELIDVAKLGLPQTQRIVETIFPDLKQVRIYRIDLCLDVMGYSPWFFVTNTRVPKLQNFALYRSRGAISFYLQFSSQNKIVFYDRLRLLKKQNDPLARVFGPEDRLTRIEVQLMGAAVPFKRFLNIRRYSGIDLLENVKFASLRPEPDEAKPMPFLAATGLRSLITKHGLQTASKMFSSPSWAWLERRFLKPMMAAAVPDLSARMRKSVTDWLEGRIRFPRAPEKKYSL